MRRLCSMALLVGLTLLGAACGGAEEAPLEPALPTWEEFQARTPRSGDVYIVEGDQALEGVEALRAYYDSLVQARQGTREQGLAIYFLNGADVKWNSTLARNLTYCVNLPSFGSSRYALVVNALASAATAWESCANVNFIHRSTYDNSGCTASQTGVVFDVRQSTDGAVLARAFFPNASRLSRNLVIDNAAFGNIAPFTLAGVMRHELGHVLGFRHEHTRLTSTGCYEDSQWRALTSYDRSSVMHYPWCGGQTTGDLVLTSLDCSGARAVYP